MSSRRYLTQRHRGHKEKHIKICVRPPGRTAPDETGLPVSGAVISAGCAWGDESVVDALKKLIPFLFRSFCNRLIFKLKKIGGTKTGSQLATLSVIFSSAQVVPSPESVIIRHILIRNVYSYFSILQNVILEKIRWDY